MNIRELLSDAAQEAWRQKGVDKAHELVGKLAEKNPSEEELFHQIQNLYRTLDGMKEKCQRHFNESGEYDPPEYGELYSKPEQIAPTYGCLLKVRETQRELCRMMATSPFSRTNGTSVAFNDCAVKSGLDVNILLQVPVASIITLPESAHPSYKYADANP